MLKQSCSFLPKLVLTWVGLNLQRKSSFSYKIYAVVMITSASLYPWSNFHLLLSPLDDYDTIINALFAAAGGSVSFLKIVIILRNRQKILRILERVERLQKIYIKENWSKEEVYKANKGILIIILTFYLALLYFDTITLTGRFLNKDPRTWKLPISEVSVFDWRRSTYYEIAWLYQTAAVFVVSSVFWATDLLIGGLLVDMTVQFKILQQEISMSFNNLIRNGENKDPKALQQFLKEKVIRHVTLIDLVDDIEDSVSLLILVSILGSLAVISFSLYHASVLPPLDFRALQSYCEALVIVLSFFLLAHCGTAVSDASCLVAAGCYELDFVGADAAFQKDLLMMIVRSQKPAKITARKFVALSITVFVWILKSSFSYIMVLRKRNN